MIEEAMKQALSTGKELGRRELQSAQDRNKAALKRAERKAQLAEQRLRAARQQVESVDPDLAEKLELAERRAQEQSLLTFEQEEEAERIRQEFDQQFRDRLSQFIEKLGVDPKDERIDWDSPFQDYLELQGRILDTVGEIQKENVQKMQESLEKRLRELEAKVNQVTTEANSVSTAGTGTAPAGSDAEFIKKFGNGELPLTQENIERYNRIVSESS
jgi:hypothetical protein